MPFSHTEAKAMIPQIESVKKLGEFLNVRMLINYPSNTPFGNLNLVQMEVVGRVDYINSQLTRLYQEYRTYIPELNGFVDLDILWFRLRIEEIMYWIRKTADNLIALSWVLGEYLKTGGFPKKIAVDCIGGLLDRLKKDGQPSHIEFFRPHAVILKLINDISNTYKHHFVNHDNVNVLGVEGPTVYWTSMDRNDSQNCPRFQGVTLSEPVAGISRLLGVVFSAHRLWLSQT
jgi:hypothetical protein